MAKTAILIDGGFYRKRAAKLWGIKSAEDRADELYRYVFKHIGKQDGGCKRELYRIFYYDCPPVQSVVYHPLLKRNVEFGKHELYQWTNDFFDCLKKRRKVALRLGRLSTVKPHYTLDHEKVKKLCSGSITIEDLVEDDFRISFKQKGVDMRIGTDISSLAYEGVVSQIILIAGDSDFVPAAKAARRKGVDFILDPMGNNVSDDLFEHIDGKESFTKYDPQIRKQKADDSLEADSSEAETEKSAQ